MCDCEEEKDTNACILMIPASLHSSTGNRISIGSDQAHGFLSNSRSKRNLDPKWYRTNPDFQSYYRFYNSIGHTEGVR